MAFFDQYASRLNEAVVKHLTDGLCTYHPATGPDVLDVPYQFDNEFEVIDENGIGRRVKTLLLPVAVVGDVDRRAEFTVSGKRWRYNGPVEDDGAFVRIEVV
jgi:hypothetical protein